MKKTIAKFLIIFLFLTIKAFAQNSIYVESLEDYKTIEPKESLQVKVLFDTYIENTEFKQDDIINCALNKIKKPNRGKQNAKLYFNIESLEKNGETIVLKTPLLVKYSLTSDLKEKIKSIPPSKAVKKTAGLVGGYFIKGFSYGFSFVDGIIENPQGNRLKSGAKQVYDDSFLSMVEYGKEIEINKEDRFYLIVKKQEDIDEEEIDEEIEKTKEEIKKEAKKET